MEENKAEQKTRKLQAGVQVRRMLFFGVGWSGFTEMMVHELGPDRGRK